MTDEMIPAEVFETEGYGEDQWAQLLDWAERTAEAGKRVVLDDVPETARWQCTTEADAEWAMARLREHVAEIDEVTERYAEYIRRLEEQRGKRLARAAAGAGYLETQLQMWAERRRAENPDVKTTHLASGAIRTRAVAAKPVIEDQRALVEWFKTAGWGADVKVVESIPMATLNRRGKLVEAVTHTAVELQCGDQRIIEGTALVGQVAACDLHPGDLVMISEVLDHLTGLKFLAESGDELPGVRVEPERISVSVDPIVS